ncbi:dihydroorotate dehydrogenase (quinone) [Coxiella endosymbiont of Amblyomma americanum]|uniref:dihydroorotate dehydrogenase (quinone) n=1 Tax=Coxiella endosymbiont of Amblyomma americanum TaxID=325775 RepID=UPI00057FECAC|nr:dihydroorotate dehydrogenase (quinone) [Coxiella endosymbiont of Amblyomma americanum]AJC50583.1 dihydroorotate dehydrogenase [Coxiella endosymbiont of Amblyomma americanum]AUJ58915.1 dihydroorotate dehydrogenase (quinone) [Coxiella-like endosymbiont of Amblyomma americanum]
MIYKFFRLLSSPFDPEKIHCLFLNTLKAFYRPLIIKKYLEYFPKKPVSILGLRFTNPIGLAAGLDKNGNYIDVLLGLGFGFVEIGSITPKPQPGNQKPRLFYLCKDQALINHLGFNNLGVDYCVEQLKKRKMHHGIVGVNIGKNVTTSLKNAYKDYQYCFEKVYRYSDYITINISSPNTPNLRELQSGQYFSKLVNQLKEKQYQLENQYQRHVPLLFKISPDLTQKQLQVVASLSLEYHIEGLIATNTTNRFQGITEKFKKDGGGISGKPLFSKALFAVQQLRMLVKDTVPIIGVGGISSPKDAIAFLKAGACLIQIYTGLVYKGPSLIKSIVHSLEE